MLRLFGADLDIDVLLQEIDLVPESSYRRGEPKSLKRSSARKNDESGAGFLVSDAGFDNFEGQKSDVLRFLKEHRQVLSGIMDRADVEGGTLDFGISRRDVVVQNDFFSPGILQAIAHFGFGMNLSHYPMLNDDGQAGGGIEIVH